MPMTLEEKIDHLARQLHQLGEIVLKNIQPQQKFCLTVEEVAARWDVGIESVRRMIRQHQLKPLRGFRPFRIPLDEIRRFETQDQQVDKLALLRSRHLSK